MTIVALTILISGIAAACYRIHDDGEVVKALMADSERLRAENRRRMLDELHASRREAFDRLRVSRSDEIDELIEEIDKLPPRTRDAVND